MIYLLLSTFFLVLFFASGLSKPYFLIKYMVFKISIVTLILNISKFIKYSTFTTSKKTQPFEVIIK